MQTVGLFKYNKRLNISINPSIGTLADASTSDQSEYSNNTNEAYSTIHKGPGLKPHHKVVSCHTQNTKSIRLIDEDLRVTVIPIQSVPGHNGNKGHFLLTNIYHDMAFYYPQDLC